MENTRYRTRRTYTARHYASPRNTTVKTTPLESFVTQCLIGACVLVAAMGLKLIHTPVSAHIRTDIRHHLAQNQITASSVLNHIKKLTAAQLPDISLPVYLHGQSAGKERIDADILNRINAKTDPYNQADAEPKK